LPPKATAGESANPPRLLAAFLLLADTGDDPCPATPPMVVAGLGDLGAGPLTAHARQLSARTG